MAKTSRAGGNHTPIPAQRNLEANYILEHPRVPTQRATHELFRDSVWVRVVSPGCQP